MTSRRWTEGGKGRRTGLSKATAGALAVGLLVGTIVAVSALQAISSTGDEGCEGSDPPLRIVAVPEVAEVLSRVVQLNSARVRDCPLPISITAGDAGATALGIRDDTIDRPDIWIPDSSLWIERAGAGLPANSPSVASSPLTLAVTPKVAQSIRADAKTLTLDDLLPASPNAAGPARWMLPEADRSASTIGALIGLRASVGKRADANALLSTVIRACRPSARPACRAGYGPPQNRGAGE